MSVDGINKKASKKAPKKTRPRATKPVSPPAVSPAAKVWVFSLFALVIVVGIWFINLRSNLSSISLKEGPDLSQDLGELDDLRERLSEIISSSSQLFENLSTSTQAELAGATATLTAEQIKLLIEHLGDSQSVTATSSETVLEEP
jgi:uncharacterized membrane-anchored protein YhcB (DUF1043 family)